MQKLWKEFVAFIMTGNVLMLAVAFVMGGLTKKVIDDFVNFGFAWHGEIDPHGGSPVGVLGDGPQHCFAPCVITRPAKA